jgi:hypothetical protein
VSSAGADSNDGLSWGSSKLTIYAAICSLANGNCGTQVAGSGTVYVAPNSAMNQTSTAGIWLMGANDPNYASPPTGWLKMPRGGTWLSVIGVGTTFAGDNGHLPVVPVRGGSASDTHHPSIDVSAWGQPLHFENLLLPSTGRSIVLGECSNFTDRTGTCVDSSIHFDNVVGGLSQTASNGPCTDITGQSFWIWLNDFVCAGNPNATGGIRSNAAAAVLIDGATNGGPGLIYINDLNTQNGGILYVQGTNLASLYVNHYTEEGGGQPCPPAVRFAGFNNGSDSILNNVLVADCGGVVAVENDGGTPGPTVFNTYGPPAGPAVFLNPELPPGTVINSSPLSQGESGIMRNYLIGQTNVARRIGALIPSRSTNKASSSPSGWGAALGSPAARITTGITDPFGGTGAASVASNGVTTFSFNGTSYPPWSGSPGDWVVGGVWVKNFNNNGGLSVASCPTGSSVRYSRTLTNPGELVNNGSGIVDSWEFIWTAGKIGNANTGNQACLTVGTTKASTPIFYGPVLYFLPQSLMTDNEVIEFATTMNSLDSSCLTGSVCNVSGHPLSSNVFAVRPTTTQYLPTCTSTTEGQMMAVKDASVNTWGSTFSGSGTNHVLVYCDGTSWRIMAK